MPLRREVSIKDAPTEPSLFGGPPTKHDHQAPKSCLMVTNHLNLMYMLAAGLIMPPSGFGGKYYQDTLGCYRGWIPLFPGLPLAGALEYSTSEESHLRPCIARVRTDLVSGRAWAFRGERVEEIDFPAQSGGNDQLLMLPAPLPTHWIEEVLFPSGADKRAFEADVQRFGDVSLGNCKCRVDKKSFDRARHSGRWPPSDDGPERNASLAESQAAGGIAAMLFHVGNKGANAIRACQLAFDPAQQDGQTIGIPIIEPLVAWRSKGTVSPESTLGALSEGRDSVAKSQRQIFWGVVEHLVAWNRSRGAETAEDVIVRHLGRISDNLPDRLRKKFQELANALSSFATFGSLSLTEMLERYPTPFSRSMTLCFRHKTCASLLDYEHDLLQEDDWVLAAILCGARDGWERLPRELREAPMGLEAAVTHRMAAMAHQLAKTGLDLGEPAPRPQPLRELFVPAGTWRARERDAALYLARKSRWNCIETSIRLGVGAYDLRVERSGVRLVLEGEPKAVETHANTASFLDSLARARIASGLDAEIRRRLGS